MEKEIERQLEECYEHIKPYMDYEDCRNRNCFKFYLAYKYLEWDNSYKYGGY